MFVIEVILVFLYCILVNRLYGMLLSLLFKLNLKYIVIMFFLIVWLVVNGLLVIKLKLYLDVVNVFSLVMLLVKFWEKILVVLKLLNFFVKFSGVRIFVGNLFGFLIF